MTGFLDGAVIESSSGIDTGDIPASLRFRGAQYLSKTITTDATSTYFAAVKRGKLGVISPIFDTNIKFNANDTLTAFGLTTTAVFRDPTSWLFIHVSNGGLYINGVSFGAVTTSALTNPRIGFNGTNYFDGYIARIGCVAGSSSAYTNFGYLNTTINEWVSLTQSEVKAVVDAGGTNSFMLDFDDATSLVRLGYDLRSGSYSRPLITEGTNTGTFTTNGGLAASFDGNTSQSLTASSRVSAPVAGYNTAVIGKDWGAGNDKTITAVRMYGPNNGGFVGGTSNALTFKLQGSADGSAWTDLTSPITGPATGANTVITTTSGITTSTAYRYHRINYSANGTDNYYMTELEFYEDGAFAIGNNWALNNFSLTAGTTYDHMLDVPGNSFATLNPIYPSAASITNGNLTSATTAVRATQNALLYDCKWEVTAGASAVTAGVISATGTTNTTSVTANKTFAFRLTTAGALDYKNVTDAGSWTSITTGLTGEQYPYGITQAANWNFGQAPLHASATYQSAAGGYFYDTTAGYKALCQANLEEPAILNPEDHHVDIAVTKSGDTNFTLPWSADTYDTFFEIKRRDSTGDWYQIDGLRGYTKILKSNSTAAETTDANVLGISGTTGTLKSTLADGTYIVSATKAGLVAARQTNTDGSITSTVSRNVDSGFSIVTYTSPNNAANQTVGHGLGAVTKMIVAKNLDNTFNWDIYHHTLSSGYGLIYTTAAASASRWTTTAPTTTVFSTLNTYEHNSTNRYVAYCYADSAIQKSFSYTGNASADGAYADVGFKMGRALLKCSSTTGNWTVLDSERSTSNVADDVIYENLTNAEATSALADLNSRAIKFRITTDPNSAQTFIGHAWAAVTGKYSNSR